MRAKLLLVFAAVLVCVFSTAAQNVIESESSVIINERTADVTLSINSPAAKTSSVHLALLNNQDETKAQLDQTVKLAAGKRKYKFTLDIGDLMKTASDEIAWYRLSYRIDDFRGVASLSQLMADDFDLRASAFEHVAPGQTMRVRVRSLNPFTEAAVKGVQIKVALEIDLDTDDDDDELNLTGSGRTGSNGFAYVDLKIPDNIKLDGDGDGKITITGQKNGVVRKIDEDLENEGPAKAVMLTTDKPLYQPGQMFNVRALYFDRSYTVIPDSELQFTVEDENEAVVYRQTVKTSAFGIAAISWHIPDNAKLGSYHVEIDADDKLREDDLYFKVSRYDLPNFSVTAKPDKTYFLPSDSEAHVTVNADYLFGKPVTQGKVRVVEDTDRYWNYRSQTYESKEGKSVEGHADTSGKFVANINLKDDFLVLQSQDWERYHDVSFSAYYTDLTTNRTEQRRFDIRLTKEPIHVYLLGGYGQQHPDLPLTAYVSTFYADGTPAVCDVEVHDRNHTVDRFQSNSLGAGKFEFRIPKDSISEDKYDIKIVARDKKGRSGTTEESYPLTSENVVQIRTDQTIYKPGDTVEADILSTQVSGYVYVDVVKDWSSLNSAVVMLHNGKAHLSIPYKPAFKGELVIAAYTDDDTESWTDKMRAVRGIIFPEQQNLILNAKFSKDEFRPAEDATVRFSVLDGSHKPVESAIGLGIFDKAIEERARTETEFGGYFSRFYRYMGYDRSFGNITLNDLNDLDLSRPIAPEMQLAADIILADRWYLPKVYHSGNLDTEAKELYEDTVKRQLKPLRDVLDVQYKKDFDHPTDTQSLERIARAGGIDLANTLDPWGNAYILGFSVDRTEDVMTLKTAGPDKTPGTADDFVALTMSFDYFRKVGEAVDRAVVQYKKQTGKYIRDNETLTAEMRKQGMDISNLKDRWGRNYRIYFEVSGRNYTIRILSVGPNGVEEPKNWRNDDFEAWTNNSDYFGESEAAINHILNEEVNVKKKPFPRDEKSFAEMLFAYGLDIASIKDGYDRPVYVVSQLEPRYGDKTKIENGKTTITPVTQEMMMFKLRSKGSDGFINDDDSDLATFSGAVTEAFKGTDFAKVDVKTVVFAGAKGAISGTVTDLNGAVVSGATVTATDQNDNTKIYSAATDDEGKFLLSNLPSGQYSVAVHANGFKAAIVENVEVKSQTLTEIQVTLELGAATETVTVTGQSEALMTASVNASVEPNVKTATGTRISISEKEQNSTPRLREYFPETLVWQPELLTDKNGKAELKFKMADNITTWKMFAIASTKKGKIGVVEKEVTAFQSFFVDLDPPKFLTEGDEIYLPTQVRNYTEKNQKVDVAMDKADWFTFLGGAKQQVDVATGASQNAVFGFKASASVTGGKQRVSAIGQGDSDAIEKPVTVRPNGEEIVHSESQLFNGASTFKVDFPSNALANTQQAELKIYPNLFSHVADSVEGLLERPYGCGEQTTSSTYPDLMILKFVKAETPLKRTAEKYLQKGYERLLNYQVADGGFSYWGGKDASDVALTAYVLRFLNDAKPFVEVDDDVVNRAEQWLVKQQRADGSFYKKYAWDTTEDRARVKILTTYVVRTLAMLKAARATQKSVPPAVAGGAVQSQTDAALAKGLAYLKQRNAEIDEPYAMALFGLALLDAGDTETAKQIASQLETMAIPEGSAVYWKLETNTPFYGWGTAGRIETTALVLQLLTRVAKAEAKPTPDVASKGLLFLLKNKDRYGVWYSTQTTINVLDSFLAILASDGPLQSQNIDIAVNGVALPEIPVAADRVEPVTVDLAGKLSPTSNSIEVKGTSTSPLMAQMVATHYIDWRDSTSKNTDIGPSRALKLDYKCDKTAPAVMEEVTCSVDAERVGFRGYGMLLAEIGTPPGADVSRESLEAALQNDWSLSRYDILPDRIVLYMWSKAGGTHFNFKFRPRYRINAQTPASVVYDYYNPEAQAKVAPLRFVTK
jgi:hypothetical protein